MVEGGGGIKQNENYWKFDSHKGTNLGYYMIYGSVKSDQEEKQGDLLNSNFIIKLNNLIPNIQHFLVFKECSQERYLKIKLEEIKE